MPYKDPNCDKAKESHRKRQKKYYERNKENIKLLSKTCPKRLKSLRKSNWKKRGVIGDLDQLYEIWFSAEKCNICEYIFLNTKNKCLDHNHDTGLFRQILCRNCNNWDNWGNNKKN